MNGATTQQPIRVADVLRGRTIFLIGSTGFLGKVYLYLLLRRHADLERIYLMIRRKSGIDPMDRLWQDVFDAPVFDPIRESMGEEAFRDFIREKVVAVPGDLMAPGLGVDSVTRERLKGTIDVVVNSSGLVDFTPSLEEALDVNVIGIQRALDLTVEWGARYMAISTCYVAGNRGGTIFEDAPIYGYFPRKDEMPGVTFDPRREIEEGMQLIQSVRAEALHQEHENEFIHEARRRLKVDHRNPDDEAALAKALDKVREKWISKRLSADGERRANNYGWSNTYTYSKSIGEQLVVSTPGLIYSIVRPAIIESSLYQPFPGWNEGINTTAPLIFLTLQGQLNYPADLNLPLDVIPVDYIAGPMVAVTAALIQGCHKEVYQLGSSDSNPASMKRMVELTGLYKRKYYQNRGRGNYLLNELYAHVEPQSVTLDHYQTFSSPMIGKVANMAAGALNKVGAHKVPVLSQLEAGARSLEKRSQMANRLMQVFLPFTVYTRYRFKTDNIRALYARLSPEDVAAIPFAPEKLDWLTYWLDVHVEGLDKWVFPKIKDRLKKKPLPDVYRYEDLLELFDATTVNNAEKVAFRYLQTGGETTWTYAELRTRASWVATFLATNNVGPGDRIMLVSENRPEWAMSYFGILQMGASVVPVDAKSSAREITNLATAAGVKGIIYSANVARTLGAELSTSIPLVARWTFDEIIVCPESGFVMPLVPRTQKGNLASLIFTSGTTGAPKGVMLSHRNLTALLEMLAKVFRLTDKDRVVSVLPLHHTFEFTAGFLLPLSRGSQITHLEELTGESLMAALKAHKATALVGVPALWDLIARKLKTRVEEKGAVAESLFITLRALHGAFRQRTGINLGKILFGQVHSAFGGKVRYLISGAASLSTEVFDTFDALGFDLYEGYGLTEASPVLAVNRPGHRPVRGSVGVPLPGVEVKIHEPDTNGVGEIIAKAPNVMEGYFQNRDATDAVIKHGWLHTGDVGRIDKNGNVFIMGRAKEVIVDASGKNVYPDEVESLYAGCPYFKDLCVVGVPDGRGSEQVAALAILDDERAREDNLTLEQARDRIDLHMKHVAMGLPHHQRIKILRFKDGDLPRTSTRKVKRRDVVRLLDGILRNENSAKPAAGASTGGTLAHIQAMIARVTGKAADAISPTARLDADLGLDSLMATELLGAMEEQGLPSLELTDLIEAATVEGVAELLRNRAAMIPSTQTGLVRKSSQITVPSPRKLKEIFEVNLNRVHEIQVPDLVRLPIKRGLAVAQREVYDAGFDVKIKGKAFIPMDRNVLVISNHVSHLDMGLVKYALGSYAKGIVSLAAADYFFADGPMRFYFENFTNAMPLDRINPKVESIRRARNLLEQGHNLLLFPEGTRSPGGQIQPFKRGVGMMALRFGVDVLPMYLHGTHRSLPKGGLIPKSRDLEVRIGAPIRYADMTRLTRGMASLQAQTLVAQLLQKAVEALRDHELFDIDEAFHREPQAHPNEVLFHDLQGRFRPENLEDAISYYITLGGGDMDKWTVTATAAGCTVKLGRGDTPADCVIKTSPEIFQRIVREAYVPPVSDFMAGVIKTNDLGKLAKLQEIFDLGGQS